MLRALLRPRTRLLSQAGELRRLRRRIAELEAQNARMRSGMRRCLSCDYRIAGLEDDGPHPENQHQMIEP